MFFKIISVLLKTQQSGQELTSFLGLQRKIDANVYISKVLNEWQNEITKNDYPTNGIVLAGLVYSEFLGL